MRVRSVGSLSPKDILLNTRERDWKRKKEGKKEQFSMSRLNRDGHSSGKEVNKTDQWNRYQICYHGNKHDYYYGHLIMKPLIGRLCGRSQQLRSHPERPLRLAGFSDFAPSLVLAPEASFSLAYMLFGKADPIIGVKAWCHCFRPVSGMQSHDISALWWSYSLPLRIHHCQLLYSHFQKLCL